MTATLEHGDLTGNSAAQGTGWHRVCAVTDLEPGWGEAALVNGRQVALFRIVGGGTDTVYAVDQRCPATGAHVMARGILGSRGDRATVASPLHKEVYDLQTGECFTSPALHLPAFSTRIVAGYIDVAVQVPNTP